MLTSIESAEQVHLDDSLATMPREPDCIYHEDRIQFIQSDEKDQQTKDHLEQFPLPFVKMHNKT